MNKENKTKHKKTKHKKTKQNCLLQNPFLMQIWIKLELNMGFNHAMKN